MSDEHDSGGRRRRSRRGLKLPWIWIAGGVLALLLVVNLVMSLPAMMRGETPEGFLADMVSEDAVAHVGLWVALLPAAVASVLGVRWANEAFARSERPAALWMRRAFVVALTSWIAMIVVIMDIGAFESRTSVGITAAALFSITLIPFAMAARSASQGRYGGGSRSGGGDRRRRSSADEHEDEQA